MAKYQQYESVLLKDGRIATIVEGYEPGADDADSGDSPEDWAAVDGITDDEIERKATEQEMDRKYRESMRQLREQGILE